MECLLKIPTLFRSVSTSHLLGSSLFLFSLYPISLLLAIVRVADRSRARSTPWKRSARIAHRNSILLSAARMSSTTSYLNSSNSPVTACPKSDITPYRSSSLSAPSARHHYTQISTNTLNASLNVPATHPPIFDALFVLLSV